jgi:hypothetical protein
VGCDDLSDDRQSQTGTGPLMGPGGVETHEAFEDPVALAGRDTGAVIGDDEIEAVLGARNGEADATPRVTFSVLGEIGNNAAELVGVATDPRGRYTLDRNVDLSSDAQPIRVHEREIVEIDVDGTKSQYAFVETCEGEQVLDQLTHPVDFD